MPRDVARRHAAGDRGVEQARAVEVQREAARIAQRARRGEVVQRQRPAVPGVLQAQQPGAREVRVDRLDRARRRIERQRAVGACGSGCGWIEPSTAPPPPSYL
jgi:hypothetical protein